MLVGAIRKGSCVVGSGRMKKKRKRISDGSHDANSHSPLKVAIMEALFCVLQNGDTEATRQG